MSNQYKVKEGYQIKIERDKSHDESPREWDNLGIMACSHSRYDLGDEQVKNNDTLLLDLVGEYLPQERTEYGWEDTHEDWYEWANYNNLPEDIRDRLEDLLHEYYIVLPLYLYDHSGITMNTTGFSCPWDSGQVGCIYVPIEKVKDEWGWERLTKQRRQKTEEYLRNEVKTYDQYLTGDVYGFVVEKVKTLEHINSCGGFYGEDIDENGMREHLAPYIE